MLSMSYCIKGLGVIFLRSYTLHIMKSDYCASEKEPVFWVLFSIGEFIYCFIKY